MTGWEVQDDRMGSVGWQNVRLFLTHFGMKKIPTYSYKEFGLIF